MFVSEVSLQLRDTHPIVITLASIYDLKLHAYHAIVSVGLEMIPKRPEVRLSLKTSDGLLPVLLRACKGLSCTR